MKEEYIETEVKILEVDKNVMKDRLEETGATKVYDDKRIITVWDTEEREYTKSDKVIRMT